MPFLFRRALSASLLLVSSVAFSAIPQQVKTDKGTVEGEATADGKVMTFKGIPYAAPPIGSPRTSIPSGAPEKT